jgi:hypothetical protein
MRGGLQGDGDGPAGSFLAVVVLVAAIVVAGGLISVRADAPAARPAPAEPVSR